MKKIIVPTGYMMSGSSAITDLLTEFEDVSNIGGSQEYIFLHCPNGVFELENNLLNPVSHLSSKQALINFRSMMKKLYYLEGWWPSNYKNTVSENFMKYVDEYIDNLTDLKFKGFWYMDEFPKSMDLISRAKRFYQRNIQKKDLSLMQEDMFLSYPSEEKFYKESKKFIKKVIDAINKDDLSNVVIDQLLLPKNLYRMKNYFDDSLKVIVVERDPRDVFIANKYYGKECHGMVPYPIEVKEFCKMYKMNRETEKEVNNSNILRVRFEDLIYNYDKTLEKIYIFLDFSNKKHINKLKKFNPEISISNTQLFLNKKYEKEIKVIEKELSKYLYKFPYSHNKTDKDIF